MRAKRIVPFKIIHMDGLGQGVSKETDKITFISKTLPGEEGNAEIFAERKGVAFGRMAERQKTSPHRQEPECPHFFECPSCHYLHTSYDQELMFKKESLNKLLQKISHPDINVIPAPRRTGYRNRIQLHYDLSLKRLGMLDGSSGKIVPVPSCLMGERPVMEEIRRLYKDDQWIKEAPLRPVKGHLEVYWSEGKVLTNWNRPYAEGGFTQVFDEMNQLLKNLIQEKQNRSLTKALDLFAGNGNLSEKLSITKRLCVDVYSRQVSEPFFSQDLYDDQALLKVRKKLDFVPDLLLLDPPRAGLKGLENWVNELRPREIFYVSCDPHTLVRDLTNLKDHTVKEVHLLDFFPSTFHYETFIILERKS